jgi:prepilin-type N-terminal cleavage/methylation domain-containing protein
MKWTSSIKGFTLIEVMVVITIIGILASVLYANFGDARQNARNKAMRAALSEVQLALEVYKAQNSQYPAALTDLIPDFIADLPANSDSGNSSCAITYDVESVNKSYYKLTAARCFAGATSLSTGVNENDDYARCPSSCTTCNGTTFDNTYKNSVNFYESMAVYSAGGQCL